MSGYTGLLTNHDCYHAPTLPDLLEHYPRSRVHGVLIYQTPTNGRCRLVLPEEVDKALMELDNKHLLGEAE